MATTPPHPSTDLQDTIRIPTRTGLPNLRLAALFALPVMRSCVRSPRTAPIFATLAAAEALAVSGRYDRALRMLEKARDKVLGGADMMEALVFLALGRVRACREAGPEYQAAEAELRHAKNIFEALAWSPLQEILLLWATVILADMLTERDPRLRAEEAKELAVEAKELLEKSLPFADPPAPRRTPASRWWSKDDSEDETGTGCAGDGGGEGRRVRFRRWAHRRLAWFHFYMWAAISTTAIFFHADCVAEGLQLTRRLLAVTVRREGQTWLAIELKFAVGVFLSAKRDYSGALVAYREARAWHAVKRRSSRQGGSLILGSSHHEGPGGDPLMNYYIAICLSRLGRHEEALEEIKGMNLMYSILHDECDFHEDEFGNDILSLARSTCFQLGRVHDVVHLCERFALVLDEKVGRIGRQTLDSMGDHARALGILGRLDDAVVVLRTMLSRLDARLEGLPDAPTHPEWGKRLNTSLRLAEALDLVGAPVELEEAAFLYRKALESLRVAVGENVWPRGRYILARLAITYERLGRFSDAHTAYAHLQSAFRLIPANPEAVARYFWYRGKMLSCSEKFGLAAEMFRKAAATRWEQLDRQRKAEQAVLSGTSPPTRAPIQAPTRRSPEEDVLVLGDDSLAAMAAALREAKVERRPILSPFPDDLRIPLGPPAALDDSTDDEDEDDDDYGFDDDDDDDDDADHSDGDNSSSQAVEVMREGIGPELDPRVDPMLSEDCYIRPFQRLPHSFEELFPGMQRRRRLDHRNKMMQLYM